MAEYSKEDFITLYPGIYTEREKPYVEAYWAKMKAIEERGTIDVQALVTGTLPEGTSGIGPVIKATEDLVRYYNEKYDPENPILNDAEYAKKLGYKDILAYPVFASQDDEFNIPYPPEARDTLLVSQLCHCVTTYVPIYPGDILYVIHDKHTMIDLTPDEGDIHRTIALGAEGRIFNQRCELVNKVEFSVTESIRIFKEGKKPEVMGFKEIWEAPNWLGRPAHYYTDQDWENIKTMWRNEKRQGAQPLYWKDVKIGDKPCVTVDGPIIESTLPTSPYGMGVGGSKTLKNEILNEKYAPLISRNEDGIYVTIDKNIMIPPCPDKNVKVSMSLDDGRTTDDSGVVNPQDIHKLDDSNAIDTKDIHKSDSRAPLINFHGRDIAIRHIHNWMGDYGWLKTLRWGIMPGDTHAAYGKPVPTSPFYIDFIKKIPGREKDTINEHGITNDLAIVNSQVVKKYVENGEFLVDLIWWIETIEGHKWINGGATVKLP